MLAVLLLASTARLEGAGTVTGVSASPSPATAGSEITISVAGTGSCQTYVIFGDNQKSLKLTQLPAPSVKHTYAAPGSYVIRVLAYREGNEAPGLSPCSGFADTALTVNPGPKEKSMALAPQGVKPAAGSAAYSAQTFALATPTAVPPPAITKVTPSTAQTDTAHVVNFAVESSGDCNRARIDFGDGSPVQEYAMKGRKNATPIAHAYAHGGSFQIKAYGINDGWAHPPREFPGGCFGHASFGPVNVIQPMALAPGLPK